MGWRDYLIIGCILSVLFGLLAAVIIGISAIQYNREENCIRKGGTVYIPRADVCLKGAEIVK